MSRLHLETHKAHRIGWLRAAVLGANDGIVSTASLIVGVAATAAGQAEIMTAGIAGLVAGAMSMAAGEYVSVSSQADTEKADLARESKELAEQPEFELNELAAIYEQRGVAPDLAREVATPDDGQGRAGRSCPRRTGDYRGDRSPADHRRPDLGAHLRGWRRHAAW